MGVSHQIKPYLDGPSRIIQIMYAISLSSVGVKIRVHFVCLFRIPRCLLRVFVQLLAKLVQIASADRSIRKGAQAFQPFLAC